MFSAPARGQLQARRAKVQLNTAFVRMAHPKARRIASASSPAKARRLEVAPWPLAGPPRWAGRSPQS